MTQPRYVPLAPGDRVRTVEQLPPAEAWRADRPGEAVTPDRSDGPLLGSTGPDQGYGLKLARRFVERLELAPGEHVDDVVAGCLAVGLKRAALLGRAPVVYDFEHAFTLWGFLGGAPADLVERRSKLFSGASHHYWDQRAIADAVGDDVLRLSPAQVRERLGDWRSLLDLPET